MTVLAPGRPTGERPILRVGAGRALSRDDPVTVEEPLEIRVAYWPAPEPGHTPPSAPAVRSVSVTMRTPGDDFELAAGFLFTEGLLAGRADIREIRYCTPRTEDEAHNIVTVHLRAGARFDPGLLRRNFYMTSSCGVCGKSSLDAVEVGGCREVPPGALRIAPEVLRALPRTLREAQRVFPRTGGAHAAALVDEAGAVLEVREDVGRHNAVDKLVGRRLLAGEFPLAGRILVVSGRASFEILQKALMARIPAVVAVGAPSTLAVDLAHRFGMTLVGFARDEGFNVYAGRERVRLP